MSFLRSGAIVAFFTLISRIFGLVREQVMAYYFGTTASADIANIAFRLPNLFRRLVGEGALANVFVPIYCQKLQDKEGAQRFFSNTFIKLVIFLSVLALLLEVLMPYLIPQGFSGKKFEETVLLCRITMPYLVLIALCALLGAALNANKKFAAFAAMPILLSITIVSFMLTASPENKLLYFGISVLVGGIVQLVFMCIALRYNGISIRPDRVKLFSDEDSLFRKMVPGILSSCVIQVNLFISQCLASFTPGGISVLAYADRIYQFPLSIIGTCLGTILLPELSKAVKEGDLGLANTLQKRAIQIGMLFTIPSTVGLILLAEGVVKVLFEHGSFTGVDTTNTSKVITVFALALPAFVLSKIITPVFYAQKNVRTPFVITLAVISCNLASNLILIKPFGYVGIAIGSTIASWFDVVLLVFFLRKGDYSLFDKGVWLSLLGFSVASAAMSWGTLRILALQYSLHLKLVLATLVGGIVYFCTVGVLYLLLRVLRLFFCKK